MNTVDITQSPWMEQARRFTTLTDLASAYHPEVTPISARRFLLKTIRSMPGMLDDLQQVNSQPSQRLIVPCQTLAIFRWLGPPRESIAS